MDNLEKRIEGLSPAKRALLELRLKQNGARQTQTTPIKPRATRKAARLSFAQQRLWFLDQLESNGALYNVPRALGLQGELNVDALQRALNELAQRHEVFRTRFALVAGEVRQIISDEGQIPLSFSNLTDVSANHERATELAQEEAALPFNLAAGPLLRARLLRLGSREHILLLTNHHIVSDAWSGEILFKELGELYDAFVSGRPSSLEPLAIQYADFAEWQREWLQGDELERQLGYWKKELNGVAGVLDLPTDYPRASAQQSQGGYKFVTLPREICSRLNELSRREGVTLFMTLLAAFQILLSRYSGQDDIVVGSPIAGRNRTETENLIGFFINTLALRADLSGDPNFREFLGRVRETTLEAYAHQDLPFEKLVEELHPERDPGRNPLFQVMFQFQNAGNPVLQMKDVAVSVLDVSTETAKFDLMLAAREENGELVCVMEYSTELFDGETVERMLQQYATLLDGIVARPEQRISRLPLMSEVEQLRIVQDWNDTAADFPDAQTIHQLFEAQAASTPENIALIDGDTRITFGELNERANQLAAYLRRQGVGPEVRVALCLERSSDMIVGLLGILKAGGAYVPLEPNYPAERISFIIENSQAALVLTQQSVLSSIEAAALSTSLGSDVIKTEVRATRIVCLDQIREEVTRESRENVRSHSTAADASTRAGRPCHAGNAAHVIYTSGSTGLPKGVISSHAASLNRFAWMWRQYPFAKGEVCCQKTALSFVDSIWEIFGPLLQGVPLVMIADDVVKDPLRFVDTLATNNVTRLVLVPSLLRAILEGVADLSEKLRDLRICVCSGETLPLELAREFKAKLPQTTLINLYGSSEVAADVTCFELGESDATATVPVGRPIANTQVYILDSEFQPAAIGIPGEMFVGGSGLARGYLDRPELTAERFVPNPFRVGERLFRTGDLARHLPDGNIEYRGRRDHQVKLRGFRIELGEIEAVLTTHPQVSGAVVVLRDLGDDKHLVAYITTIGEEAAAADLRAHLRVKLPEYMVPSMFVRLAEMPLTASGKINRLALPEPRRGESDADFIAPRTPTEEVLASIWAAELNLETVGSNSDFFALGGHSLLLARIATRIQEVFGLELPLRNFFEASTVSALAERIEAAARSTESSIERPFVRVSREGELPLSFAQERLWFFDQLEPGSAAYNIPRALRLRGSLDQSALQQSLAAVHKRHEALRSRFQMVNGKPVLSFSKPSTHEIPLIDLSRLAVAEREAKLGMLVKEETERPFDLTRGPLLRLALIKLSSDDQVLVLTMHHIVSDGWSIGLALGELVAGYNAIVTGSELQLPELTFQYVDFAAWQRQNLSGPALEKQLEFWREQLAQAPVLINLPTDRARPALRSFRGARQTLAISASVTAGLKEISRAARSTVFMTLLTAFQLLLACLTGDDDIVVGSPSAGRHRSETESLIGFFVNTLVLRSGFSDDQEFREILRQIRDSTLKVFAHQDIPFEKLVDEFRPQRSLEFNPLFQVWFVLQNAPAEEQHWHGLAVEALNIESASTRHDLQLTLWENPDGIEGAIIEGAFTYSTDLFDAETISCMSAQFTTLLSTVGAEPEVSLSELRLRLQEAGRSFRQQQSERLRDATHDRLRTVKRRAVSGMPAAEKNA
jgi:amino acid adenylation domain-containing protein